MFELRLWKIVSSYKRQPLPRALWDRKVYPVASARGLRCFVWNLCEHSWCMGVSLYFLFITYSVLFKLLLFKRYPCDTYRHLQHHTTFNTLSVFFSFPCCYWFSPSPLTDNCHATIGCILVPLCLTSALVSLNMKSLCFPLDYCRFLVRITLRPWRGPPRLRWTQIGYWRSYFTPWNGPTL
jgi:hypothetical protein